MPMQSEFAAIDAGNQGILDSTDQLDSRKNFSLHSIFIANGVRGSVNIILKRILVLIVARHSFYGSRRSTSNESDQPESMGDLTAVIIRQENSWQTGQPLPAEELAKELRGKSNNTDNQLALICNEVYLRQLAGESPKLEDYQQRFPHIAKELACNGESTRYSAACSQFKTTLPTYRWNPAIRRR